jgi:hypothetical protein
MIGSETIRKTCMEKTWLYRSTTSKMSLWFPPPHWEHPQYRSKKLHDFDDVKWPKSPHTKSKSAPVSSFTTMLWHRIPKSDLFLKLSAENLICDGVSSHQRFANEIHSIRNLLANEWDVVISHTPKENACVDIMAKMNALLTSHLTRIDTLRPELHIRSLLISKE